MVWHLARWAKNRAISSTNVLHYPTLARVARDYLAIQGSAVKCERAFSSSGQTITDRRNSLHPQTVGALQILKSASVCQQPHLCDRGSSQACIGMIALFFSHSCHSVMISPILGSSGMISDGSLWNKGSFCWYVIHPEIAGQPACLERSRGP